MLPQGLPDEVLFYICSLEREPRRTVLHLPFQSVTSSYYIIYRFGSNNQYQHLFDRSLDRMLNSLECVLLFFLNLENVFLNGASEDALGKSALECGENSMDSCQLFARVMNDLKKDAFQVQDSTRRLDEISGAI